MMLYEPGRVFQLHENTCFSTVGGIGLVQTSPINHQFQYTKQVRTLLVHVSTISGIDLKLSIGEI